MKKINSSMLRSACFSLLGVALLSGGQVYADNMGGGDVRVPREDIPQVSAGAVGAGYSPSYQVDSGSYGPPPYELSFPGAAGFNVYDPRYHAAQMNPSYGRLAPVGGFAPVRVGPGVGAPLPRFRTTVFDLDRLIRAGVIYMIGDTIYDRHTNRPIAETSCSAMYCT